MTQGVRQQILKRLKEGGEIRGTYTSIVRQLRLRGCSVERLRKAIEQLVSMRRINRRRSRRFKHQTILSLRKPRKK